MKDWKKKFTEKYGVIQKFSREDGGIEYEYYIEDEKANKKMLNFIESLLLAERKKTLEEVWNKYVKRCHFCKGEGIWRSETDGIEEINDCKICNGNGFFFESLKYETDLRELSKITKRGKWKK